MGLGTWASEKPKNADSHGLGRGKCLIGPITDTWGAGRAKEVVPPYYALNYPAPEPSQNFGKTLSFLPQTSLSTQCL